jgi:geranylgeranyl pyrophosphate synthase
MSNQYKNIKDKICKFILKDIEHSFFKEQLEYTIFDGKYLRSIITYSIGKNLYLSAAIEYIHNSSLLIDDMPFMDNDNIRRNKETLHKKYGESTTLLTSYNLTLDAFKHISSFYTESKFINKNLIKLINIEINFEMNNLIKGQYLDLNNINFTNEPPRVCSEKIINLINYKTGSLFYLGFFFGYISKYEIKQNEFDNICAILRKIGYGFGLCFQILDDLEDYNKPNENKLINIKTYFNRKELCKLYCENLDNFRNNAIDLNIYNDVLEYLYNYLIDKFKNLIGNF